MSNLINIIDQFDNRGAEPGKGSALELKRTRIVGSRWRRNLNFPLCSANEQVVPKSAKIGMGERTRCGVGRLIALDRGSGMASSRRPNRVGMRSQQPRVGMTPGAFNDGVTLRLGMSAVPMSVAWEYGEVIPIGSTAFACARHAKEHLTRFGFSKNQRMPNQSVRLVGVRRVGPSRHRLRNRFS